MDPIIIGLWRSIHVLLRSNVAPKQIRVHKLNKRDSTLHFELCKAMRTHISTHTGASIFRTTGYGIYLLHDLR